MSRLTRRTFIQKSAFAAGALTVPAAVWSQQAPRPGKSANETLGVAVIGVKSRGGAHAKAFDAREDCRISYICDVDTSIGERVAGTFEDKPRFVTDMRRIFDDPNVDIVSIATPNHWHSLAAIWAMQAGKDVYVEKPVSHHITEGRRMVQAARKYNRICQGGTQYRSSGANRAAAEFVKAGKLGQVKLIHVCTYRPRESIGPAGAYAPPANVDYNLWSGPAAMENPIRRKQFHYDWHWFWEWGGGELANNSVHPLDAARMITDLKGLGRGVLSYGARVGIVDCAETPSVQVTVHDFGPTTVVQEVRNLKTQPAKPASSYILGTEGYLAGTTLHDLDGKVIQRFSGPSEDHFVNFLKAVRSRNRADQNAEIEEGHTSTAVIHVGNISQRLGQPASPKEIAAALGKLAANEHLIKNFQSMREHLTENGIDIEKTPLTLGPWLAIDSDKERFADNAQANALITRDYRKPFVVPAENEL